MLVGVDASPQARAALRFAARHAAGLRAPLQVLAVAEDPAAMEPAERALAGAARSLRGLGPLDARTVLRLGAVTRTLLEAAAGARVLVVGRGDRPGDRPGDQLGRTARELLTACPVPLALVPATSPPAAPGERRTLPADPDDGDVLVSLAGDDSDVPVLAAGRDWAVRRRSRLHVAHALRHGPHASVVPDAADGACLVVLANSGEDTDQLLTQVDRPVLVLPRRP
ncbi:universal stress protein [Kineococcus rhizosphaerae]|uniref:Universal stress protein family protein n=1 Tax=Kineococcus rhizosphaerae TaxID=559628 RepID=A0A2T0R359_9ACTN|nr:universal stress protein [Kineococcus rhizosphaerae]PRY14489.1 universal stress protein family protein [Kineococcus rhizosphaerae]